MKCTNLLFLCLILLAIGPASRPCYAQKALDQRVTLRVENRSINAILAQIEELAPVRFTYRSAVVQGMPMLSLRARNERLGVILDRLLTPLSIRYEVISAQQILLSRENAPDSTAPALAKRSTGTPATQPAGRLPITIRGEVRTASDDEALPGTTIQVKGSALGTVTDAGGRFVLTLPTAQATLTVSSIGYQSREIDLNNQTQLRIALRSDIRALNEVVVVGYGEQKKTSMTAAVSTLKGQEVAAKPVVNLSNSLAGRLTGVISKQGSGEPGFDGATLYIRGIATTGNAAPLVVVDD